MGIGDAILATGQARTLNEATGEPVLIVNSIGRPQWSPVFERNPRLARDGSLPCQRLVNASGSRPYIADKRADRWIWREWDIRPGELYLSAEELAYGEAWRGRVVVEPHTKVPNGNKTWPWARWQSLVDQNPERYVQVGPPGTRALRGVPLAVTPTFRQACGVLAWSRGFVGTEGALHHAAAALGVPAVVLFSEFIDVRYTGYEFQTNIRHAGEACGSRKPCHGCQRSMAAITMHEVKKAMEETF